MSNEPTDVPSDDTNELIYEVLKNIQADVAHIKARVDDHGHQLIGIRKDVHALRGDDLVPPRGHTILLPGDHVYVITRPNDESLVRLMFGAHHEM